MISDHKILEHCGLSRICDEFRVSSSLTFESIFNDILSKFHDTPEFPDSLSPLPSLFLLAALHQIPGSWRSNNTLSLSNKLFLHLCGHQHATNLADFLTVSTQESTPLVFTIFKPIQLLFSSNAWSSSPTAKLIALWLQDQFAFPSLGAYLHLFFPILLKLLDDVIPDNKLLGLKGSLRMTESVSEADLLIHNRAEVLLAALDMFLYSNYPDVLSHLHPIVSKLLSVVEQPPFKGVSPHVLGLTRHDKYLVKLLQTLSVASVIEMKRIRIRILLQCIRMFGSSLYPHLSQVVTIVEKYLELPDKLGEETRFLTLDIILGICQVCSQRMKNYLFRVSLALIKVLTQCSQSKLDAKPKSILYQQLSLKVVECLERLKECVGCRDELLTHLKAVEHVQEGSAFVKITLSEIIK